MSYSDFHVHSMHMTFAHSYTCVPPVHKVGRGWGRRGEGWAGRTEKKHTRVTPIHVCPPLHKVRGEGGEEEREEGEREERRRRERRRRGEEEGGERGGEGGGEGGEGGVREGWARTEKNHIKV